MNGLQPGDPAKLADVIVGLINAPELPLRFAAGRDAPESMEAKGNALLAQAKALRELFVSTSYAAMTC